MISIVPLIPITNHKYSCVIPLNNRNVELEFRMMYNEIAAFWYVDIRRNNELIIAGLPLIPAQDLLEQFQYLDIGHAAIMPKTQITSQFPNYDTLNTEWVLLWGD